MQLDSDDLLDAPVEAQSAFYEGPGVSRWPLDIAYTAGAEEEAEAGGQAWAERGAEAESWVWTAICMDSMTSRECCRVYFSVSGIGYIRAFRGTDGKN